jgi:hypothetical protein
MNNKNECIDDIKKTLEYLMCQSILYKALVDSVYEVCDEDTIKLIMDKHFKYSMELVNEEQS